MILSGHTAILTIHDPLGNHTHHHGTTDLMVFACRDDHYLSETLQPI